MSGYVRTDTTNNIADGNVISAADLDNEFNGVQAAFNSSTGHTHDGSSAEGAPITKLGPTQDVTVSASVLGVKTTNTVDLGTSSLKFKDFYLAGNASIGGTLTYGGVTLSNAVTGTGSMVLSASPTLTGTITAAAANFSGAVALNGNATIGDADTDTITQAASYVTGTQLKSAKTATNTLSLAAYDVDGTAYTNLITLTASNTPTLTLTSTGVGTMNNIDIGGTAARTGAFTTLSASSTVTLSGGTINGVAYLNGTNVLTTGSALTFDGTNFATTGNATLGGASKSTDTQLNFSADTGTQRIYIERGSRSLVFYDVTTAIENYRIAGITGAQTWTVGGVRAMDLTSTGLGIGTSSPAYNLEVSKSQDALTNIAVTNASAGTAAQTRLRLNNGGSNFGAITHTGASFTTSGVFRADGTYVFGNGIGGLTLTTGAAQPIYFAISNSEIARFDTSGNLLVKWTAYNGASNTAGAGINPVGQIAVERDDGAAGVFNRFSSDGQLLIFRRQGTTVGTVDVTTTGITLNGTNGITFTATQTASSDANTLDDYEEGTWTPSDQSGAGLSFTSVTATYTKVGRVVTCLFGVTYPTTSTGNQVVIGGFPFTNTGTGPLGGGVINYTNAAITNAYFSLAQSSTLLYAYTSGAAALANITLSGSILRLTVTYMV
jgi:hypothetical protein